MKELWKAFLNRRENRKHIFLTPGVTESLAQNYLPWHYVFTVLELRVFTNGTNIILIFPGCHINQLKA